MLLSLQACSLSLLSCATATLAGESLVCDSLLSLAVLSLSPSGAVDFGLLQALLLCKVLFDLWALGAMHFVAERGIVLDTVIVRNGCHL